MDVLTADQVADLLNLSRNQVFVMAKRGEIPARVIAGRIRFLAEEIEEWLKMRPKPSPAVKYVG